MTRTGASHNFHKRSAQNCFKKLSSDRVPHNLRKRSAPIFFQKSQFLKKFGAQRLRKLCGALQDETILRTVSLEIMRRPHFRQSGMSEFAAVNIGHAKCYVTHLPGRMCSLNSDQDYL